MSINEEAKELLRDDIMPILLDNGLGAHRFATRIATRYGIACTLCGERRNLLDLLDLNTGFYRLSRHRGSRLAAEQLTDLAELYSDRLLLLVPIRASDCAWLAEQRAVLESRFVCVEREELEENWLRILGIG